MQGLGRLLGIFGAGAVAALVAACGSKSGAGEGGSAGATGTTSTTRTSDAGAGGSVGHGGAGGNGADGGTGGTGGTTTSVPETDAGSGGPCPTTGAGAIKTTGATCLAFPPTATGASSAGENPDNANYALAPDSGANGQLVLFLNGSGGHPSDQIAGPIQNFYNAAAGLGYHVLAVS